MHMAIAWWMTWKQWVTWLNTTEMQPKKQDFFAKFDGLSEEDLPTPKTSTGSNSHVEVDSAAEVRVGHIGFFLDAQEVQAQWPDKSAEELGLIPVEGKNEKGDTISGYGLQHPQYPWRVFQSWGVFTLNTQKVYVDKADFQIPGLPQKAREHILQKNKEFKLLKSLTSASPFHTMEDVNKKYSNLLRSGGGDDEGQQLVGDMDAATLSGLGMDEGEDSDDAEDTPLDSQDRATKRRRLTDEPDTTRPDNLAKSAAHWIETLDERELMNPNNKDLAKMKGLAQQCVERLRRKKLNEDADTLADKLVGVEFSLVLRNCKNETDENVNEAVRAIMEKGIRIVIEVDVMLWERTAVKYKAVLSRPDETKMDEIIVIVNVNGRRPGTFDRLNPTLQGLDISDGAAVGLFTTAFCKDILCEFLRDYEPEFSSFLQVFVRKFRTALTLPFGEVGEEIEELIADMLQVLVVLDWFCDDSGAIPQDALIYVLKEASPSVVIKMVRGAFFHSTQFKPKAKLSVELCDAYAKHAEALAGIKLAISTPNAAGSIRDLIDTAFTMERVLPSIRVQDADAIKKEFVTVAMIKLKASMDGGKNNCDEELFGNCLRLLELVKPMHTDAGECDKFAETIRARNQRSIQQGRVAEFQATLTAFSEEFHKDNGNAMTLPIAGELTKSIALFKGSVLAGDVVEQVIKLAATLFSSTIRAGPGKGKFAFQLAADLFEIANKAPDVDAVRATMAVWELRDLERQFMECAGTLEERATSEHLPKLVALDKARMGSDSLLGDLCCRQCLEEHAPGFPDTWSTHSEELSHSIHMHTQAFQSNRETALGNLAGRLEDIAEGAADGQSWSMNFKGKTTKAIIDHGKEHLLAFPQGKNIVSLRDAVEAELISVEQELSSLRLTTSVEVGKRAGAVVEKANKTEIEYLLLDRFVKFTRPIDLRRAVRWVSNQMEKYEVQEAELHPLLCQRMKQATEWGAK